MRKFSVISISAGSCSLSCTYCNSTYIKSMEPAISEEEFYKILKKKYERGVKGFLISGGFDPQGRLLNLKRILPVMKRVKRELEDVIFNIHPGLIERELIEEMSGVVDIVDYEFAYSPRAFESKGIKRSREDYIKVLEDFITRGPKYIVPHIILGFPNDNVEESIKIASSMKPYLINFLVLIPTKGTPSENFSVPQISDVINHVELGSRLMNRKVSIGCMRPYKIKDELDKIVIERGLVERISNPSKKLWGYLEMYDACCSLPLEYLNKFEL
ncbi:radical SAM protein [Sulfolobus sp. S-194]|uniref:radical SAM protein n=1 Tax=Sulfolobus sp. S-194 TaxID=2512240 RepID=UPI002570E319|nr:radical SAM protein [Sulfolobus sp. S-194]